MIKTLDCPHCGAPLDNIRPGILVTQCNFCHSNILLPAELFGRSIAESNFTPPDDLLVHAQDLKRMVELARSGNQIEAMHIFREVFDTSLADSKRAIDAITTGQPVIMPGIAKSQEGALSRTMLLEKIASLYRSGNPLEAIKLFKDTYAASLRDAKELVEQLGAGAPVRLPDGTEFQLSQGFTELSTGYTADQSGRRSKSMVAILAAAGLVIGLAAVAIVLVSGLTTQKQPGALVAVFSTDTPMPTATAIPFASPVLSFGGEGTGAGLFQDAREIGVDQNGNIYVGDIETQSVQAFKPDGTFIARWFTGKRDNGSDLNIAGMAVTLDGRVYIAAYDAIFVFDGQSGERLDELTYPENGHFEDVAAAPDGSLVAVFFTEHENIIRFDKNNEVDLFIERPIGNVTDHSELDTTVAVDGLGNIYLLGSFNNLAFIYNREGKYQNRFGSEGDGPGTFRAVDGIAVDNQSRIYISDFDGLQIFDSSGRFIESFPIQAGLRDIAFDLQGAIYTVNIDQVVIKYRINQ